MNLEMIADKLQADGVGMKGKTIFINHMPSDVVPGILLRPPYIGTPIDYELPGYRKTTFNVAVRGTTYVEGDQLAKKVMKSLTFSEVTLGLTEVRYVRPETEPVSFPVSDGALVEFLMIFEAVYVIVE